MANEEGIRQELISRFDCLTDKFRVARERRMFVDVPVEKFIEVVEYAQKKLEFVMLCTITGLDEGDNLSAMYHLARADGTMLNVKTSAPKTKPVIPTITKFFPGGEKYERELMDLLGIEIQGLSAGKNYPLPEGWPAGQYPLRKNWKVEMLGLNELPTKE